MTDRQWERTKEVFWENAKWLGLRLLIIAGILLILASFVMSSNTDPRIISIAKPDGSTWVNPIAEQFTHNVACDNTFSRLVSICSTFCSASQKAIITEARDDHQFYRDHYTPRIYEGANWTVQDAYKWETKWIDFYQGQLDECAKCNGIASLSGLSSDGKAQVVR